MSDTFRILIVDDHAVVRKGLAMVLRLEPDFEIRLASEASAVLTFVHPLEVFRHLKHTGVNSLGDSHWSRSRWQKLAAAYRAAFPHAEGVTLTYHPLMLLARRRT